MTLRVGLPAGVQRYETWDKVRVGQSGPGMRQFVSRRRHPRVQPVCLETDRCTRPGVRAQPGGLWQHPLFIVQIVFWCIDTGIVAGCARRARNPGQTIELHERSWWGRHHHDLHHADKWIRRGKTYIEDRCDLHNEQDLKATWWTRLIIPPNGAELAR